MSLSSSSAHAAGASISATVVLAVLARVGSAEGAGCRSMEYAEDVEIDYNTAVSSGKLSSVN